MKECDFLVIGGGSAGYAAARTAAAAGLGTVLVEGAEEMGGLCILRGCMPSKTLIESANRYSTLRRANEFGLRAEKIGFDGKAIIARKRRLIAEFAEYRVGQLTDGPFELLRGRAAFEDEHTVHIQSRDGGGETVRFHCALIATGSVINQPDLPGLSAVGAMTSDDVLDGAKIPSSIIVLGAGPVALEAAYYYQALGVPTCVIQRSGQVLTGTDPDVAKALEEALTHQGMRIFTGTRFLETRRERGEIIVEFEHNGQRKTERAAALLNALGRRPAVDGLALEAARVRAKDGVIETRATQQTSTAHIFAAGDVCGPYEIVHIAIQQGEIAARNAARLLRGEQPAETMDYRLKLFVVFTEPQVAIAGMGEREAGEKELEVVSAKHPFNDHGKSMVMGETEGFVKLIAARATGEILGGAVVGPHASDLIHELVAAMRFHATAAQFAEIPRYHPTLSEIWSYPAEELVSP